MDWKFLIGDVIIPIALFFLGMFIGKTVEKRKNNKSKIQGHHNTVIQDSTIEGWYKS